MNRFGLFELIKEQLAEKIQHLQESITLKPSKTGNLPYVTCLVRKKDIKLTPEEIVAITGCARRGDQVEWLTLNGWTFHQNKAREPIVGRMYARLRMAGITPAALTTTGGWVPDFSSL